MQLSLFKNIFYKLFLKINKIFFKYLSNYKNILLIIFHINLSIFYLYNLKNILYNNFYYKYKYLNSNLYIINTKFNKKINTYINKKKNNSNLILLNNKKYIFYNNKIYFLINFIKIEKNLLIDIKNLGLNKKNNLIIINILNEFIDINRLSYGDKLIIFSKYNNIKNINFNINNLICIKIIINNKEKYIFKLLSGKYLIYNLYNIKFINLLTKNKFKISSKFNLNRLNPITSKISPHKGIDIAMPIGTPILSINSGIIKESSSNNISGKYIVVEHNNKILTKYMHLSRIIVKLGQKVNIGECIGYSGNSGRSTGPHLHFEIWINYKAVNPLKVKNNNKYYNKYLISIKKTILNIEYNISKFINL